jgi:hypothetical protein
MYGLMAICHEAGKGGYIGSHWPNHARAVFLPDTPNYLFEKGFGFP